jgi:3-hydroxybutyryl-CoA dehydrogenase
VEILIIGDDVNLQEIQSKFGKGHNYQILPGHREAENYLDTVDLVFDFVIDEEPAQIDMYCEQETPIFLNSCKISLAELSHMADHTFRCALFGFNGLPTFLNRELLEVSLMRADSLKKLTDLCKALNTDFVVVDDRVGMVTPRIICMIINEAFYTVQEGTATRHDIDLAMKMGTNYPYGPFEWCHRIGIKHVYELLDAIYEDTRDERYKICPLLKKEYLRT